MMPGAVQRRVEDDPAAARDRAVDAAVSGAIDDLAVGGPWDAGPAARRTGLLSIGAVAVVAGLAVAAAAVAPSAGAAAGPLLLIVAGLVGLPHGAVDHLALSWAAGREGAARPLVLVAYAVAAVATAVAALVTPLPAVLVLLVLSAAHFAEGEAAFDRLRGGAGRAMPATALGVAVVAVPLVLRPAQVRPLLAALDPGLPGVLEAVRLPLLAATAVLVALGLGVALRAGERPAARELALVAVAVVLAPPLVTFAVWFGGWHAPRHLVRLAALEPSGDGPERLRRLARGAAAPTVVAVAGLAGLAVLLGGLPGAVLVVLLALTVPHAAVVARLDRLAVAARPARQRSGTKR